MLGYGLRPNPAYTLFVEYIERDRCASLRGATAYNWMPAFSG
jgi:hypothetical protein